MLFLSRASKELAARSATEGRNLVFCKCLTTWMVQRGFWPFRHWEGDNPEKLAAKATRPPGVTGFGYVLVSQPYRATEPFLHSE